MFAGIIKETGTISAIEKDGTNVIFSVESDLSPSLSIDQSVAHNGVCLTVVEVVDRVYKVVAILETLNKSNLGELQIGDLLNLEVCITADQKIDGHFVQGHVDTKGSIAAIESVDGSWFFTVNYPESFATLLVPKGSVCINGISLTVIAPGKDSFKVAIIPYTFEHTNLHKLKVGSTVNLEFDILGKYIQRRLEIIA